MRAGAAYGLAGMVKGLGIIAFKQLDIMSTLTEAIQDKKSYKLVDRHSSSYKLCSLKDCCSNFV